MCVCVFKGGLALTPSCGCRRHCKRRHILKTKLTSRGFPRKTPVKRKRRLLGWQSSSEPLPSHGKKLSTPRVTFLAVDRPPRKLAEFLLEKLSLLVSFNLRPLRFPLVFLFIHLELLTSHFSLFLMCCSVVNLWYCSVIEPEALTITNKPTPPTFCW